MCWGAARLDALVACALLYAQEVSVRGQLKHDIVRNVLPRAPWHVIKDARALIQHRAKVVQQTAARRLAVIRVDLQRRVHAHRKALLRRMNGLARRIAAGVANNKQLPAKLVDGVCYQPAA